MPTHDPAKPVSAMTQWRKEHPEQARQQRENELAKRKAKTLAKREEVQRQAALQPPPSVKRCSQCGHKKLFCEFNKNARSKDGYRPECRECQKIATETDKPQRQARDAERKEVLASYSRQYHQEHRQTILARHAKNRRANAVERHAYAAKYRKENLDYFRLAGSRYRARSRELPDTWTAEQKDFMLDYWGHACAACGNPKGFFWTLAYDHFIPLVSPNCPGTVATNMIPLCHGENGCNNSKHAQDPQKWLIRRFGPKKAAKIAKAIATYFAVVAQRFPETITFTERTI